MTTPTAGQPLLDVAGLRVTYGGVVAVSDVDLRIGEGTIYGLIGPNGAGKTSMVDALTGYTRPAAGRITFGGRDIGGLRPYRRARLGLARTFQSVELFDDLTVEENLLVASEHVTVASALRDLFLPQRPYLPLGTLADAIAYPELDHAPIRAELEAALRAVGLAYLTDQLDVEGNWSLRLSGGEQQRLGFARVLLVRPEIVFLDEATSALDEAAEASLYRLIREAEWGPTVVSVGHHGTLKRFHERVLDLGRYQVSEAVVAGD